MINENNLNHISKVLSDRKSKEINLTLEEAIEIIAYSLQAIYGEILKLITLLILAKLLNILLPTLIITMVFSMFRVFAGGVHMNTKIKCFLIMFIMFLGSGQIVQCIVSSNYNPVYNLILISIVALVGKLTIKRYAPQDTPNKPIVGYVKRQKFKKLSYIFLLIILILCLILIRNNLIVLSILTGLLLELWTITPYGVKFFTKANVWLGGTE